MKSTIPRMILGGVMAFTLAACNTTPMNSNASMGGSMAGTSSASDGTTVDGTNKMRGAAPVNCTTNMNSDGTNASNTPGTKCPTESH